MGVFNWYTNILEIITFSCLRFRLLALPQPPFLHIFSFLFTTCCHQVRIDFGGAQSSCSWRIAHAFNYEIVSFFIQPCGRVPPPRCCHSRLLFHLGPRFDFHCARERTFPPRNESVRVLQLLQNLENHCLAGGMLHLLVPFPPTSNFWSSCHFFGSVSPAYAND